MFCGNAGLRNYLKIRLHISSALLSFLACWPPVQINSAHLEGEKEHCQGTALLFGMLVFSVPFPLETTNSILSLLALSEYFLVFLTRVLFCLTSDSSLIVCVEWSNVLLTEVGSSSCTSFCWNLDPQVPSLVLLAAPPWPPIALSRSINLLPN